MPTPARVAREPARRRFLTCLQDELRRGHFPYSSLWTAAEAAGVPQASIGGMLQYERGMSDGVWAKLTDPKSGPFRFLGPEVLARLAALRADCYAPIVGGQGGREGAGEIRMRWEAWIADVDTWGEDAALAWQLLRADIMRVIKRQVGKI